MAVIEDTKGVRRNGVRSTELDATDRKLLALLAEDASRSYAHLSEALHLSAPAVHERVKRLKRDGVIKAIEARLDGAKIGRPLLAFIHVQSEGWGKSPEMLALSSLAEVEEIHSVTGDACLLLKVRTRDAQHLEELLRRIYDIPTVKNTTSYVALSTHTERGPRP